MQEERTNEALKTEGRAPMGHEGKGCEAEGAPSTKKGLKTTADQRRRNGPKVRFK